MNVMWPFGVETARLDDADALPIDVMQKFSVGELLQRRGAGDHDVAGRTAGQAFLNKPRLLLRSRHFDVFELLEERDALLEFGENGLAFLAAEMVVPEEAAFLAWRLR